MCPGAASTPPDPYCGQPYSALTTARLRNVESQMSAGPEQGQSPCGHASTGVPPSAISMSSISSLMFTAPSPLQSPSQHGGAAATDEAKRQPATRPDVSNRRTMRSLYAARQV